MSLTLGISRSEVIQHSEIDSGQTHVVPQLLPVCVREVVHRFALDDDGLVAIHDEEIEEVLMVDRLSFVLCGEVKLLVEGDVAEGELDRQRVLVHVLRRKWRSMIKLRCNKCNGRTSSSSQKLQIFGSPIFFAPMTG